MFRILKGSPKNIHRAFGVSCKESHTHTHIYIYIYIYIGPGLWESAVTHACRLKTYQFWVLNPLLEGHNLLTIFGNCVDIVLNNRPGILYAPSPKSLELAIEA